MEVMTLVLFNAPFPRFISRISAYQYFLLIFYILLL